MVNANMKTDTRRKITFYLNPETSEADKYVCQKIDATPQGDRGKLWRAALVTGFAFGKHDERLPYLISELLNEKTSLDNLLQLMKAVIPVEGAIPPGNATVIQQTSHGPVEISTEQGGENETRSNAKSMFGSSHD